ncbi:MAG: FAD-dependent oxidoreductase [Pyrinomonadaceae bacterium]
MNRTLKTACCIAGGGPAGIMLGLLLARTGVEVIVCEKHGDFLRDFRGDTIHPSTLELMYELGLLEEFLKRPHQEVRELGGQIGDEFILLADFSHLPTRCRFLALMPQWDFLDFIAQHAARYPTFSLRMNSQIVELLHNNGQIVGVIANEAEGPIEIRSDLVVGADGRHSVVREKAELASRSFGAPMDVLWFRVPRLPTDGEQTLGSINDGRMMVSINRDDYWQCAYLIRKGDYPQIKQRGLPLFKNDVASIAPFLSDRLSALNDWNDIKLLTVLVDRLQKWYRPGLLCIGDAAHAMSPIGGVGINLAIQDAVAAANILSSRLLRESVTAVDLERVQLRRELPTRITQGVQVFIQNQLIKRILGKRGKLSLPWPLKLFRRFPLLRRIPARLVGLGFRPEHIRPRNTAL